MTDEQMDARLRAAGARWRENNPTVAVVEPVVADEGQFGTSRPPRRRWGLLSSAAAVAAALVVGGTFLLHDVHRGSTPPGDTAALENHVWLLTGRAGENSTATLFVDGAGNLVADDECQLIGGHVALDGATMTVSHRIVRYKSCTDQYGPGYYQAGSAVLAGDSTFTITADALTITKDGAALRFVLAPQGTPAPTLDFPTLVGANWTLVSAKGADGNAITVAGEPTFRLGDGGSLTGDDGCNTMHGTATVDFANVIHFGGIGGTEKLCTGAAGATETAVLSVLQGTVHAVASSGELVLTKGDAELRFRWDPPATGATDPAALAGVTWHLVSDAGTQIPLGVTVRFGDGVISVGGSSCHPVKVDIVPGSFRVNGLSTGTRTTGPCPAAALYDFVDGGGRCTWRIADGQLILFTDTQAFALVFDSGTPAPTTDARLIGPTWHLTSITSGGGRYRDGAPPAEQSTLHFTASGFTIRHTCYTQEGDARTSTGTVAIHGARSVGGHSCPFQAGRDDAAQVVDSILTGTLHWSIDSGRLTLTNGTDTLEYADTTTTTQDRPLVGTDWRLETAVTDSGGNLPAKGLSLAVDASGRLVADDGTNAINAQVTAHDGVLGLADLAVGGAGSTGLDPVRAVVDEVIQQGSIGYQISGDVLTLTSGAAQLIYRAQA